jgi:hypothetical protein
MKDEDGTPIPIDKLAEIYIKIRDARQEAQRKFDEADAGMKEQLDTIAARMLEVCKATGADSIKTKAGTIVRSVKTRYWTSDWESMYAFISENNALPLLEKRIAQTNMKQFLEENPEVLPKGLNVDNEYTIVVRRSKA